MRIQALLGTAGLCACLLTASCGDEGGSAVSAPTAPAVPAPGAISVPPSLSFGYVQVGEAATRILHITNNGRTDLAWTGVTSSSDAFSASPATGTLPAGETRAVEVTFAPGSAGDFAATITVASNAASGVNTTSVTGHSSTRGIALSGDLAFGDVPVGESASATLAITNSGNTDLTFSSVSSSDSAFAANPGSGTVPARGTRTVTVTFTPTSIGRYDATITVASDAIVVQSTTISASGTGTPARPTPPPVPPSTPFALASSSFPNGALIPPRFAKCPTGAGNVSPALTWTNPPGTAQSFVVIVDDPSVAPTFTHWVLFNIPASVTSLSEGASIGTAGTNDFGRPSYDGPCPPVLFGGPGGSHTYRFTVYALSTASISVVPGANRTSIENAFAPFVISSARISGVYP